MRAEVARTTNKLGKAHLEQAQEAFG